MMLLQHAAWSFSLSLQMLVTSNDSRMRLYDLRDLTLTCKYKGGTNNNSQIKASFRYVILNLQQNVGLSQCTSYGAVSTGESRV